MVAARRIATARISDGCVERLSSLPALQSFFARALAIDAEARFHSSADLLAALESLALDVARSETAGNAE
jgi:hypothetical protein